MKPCTFTFHIKHIQPSTLNLAPQKPDADLKRDVEKKLRKLARRTQRAIRELIRTLYNNNNIFFYFVFSTYYTHQSIFTEEKLEAEQNGEYDGVTGDAADQLD